MNVAVRQVTSSYGFLGSPQKAFVDSLIENLEVEAIKQKTTVFELLLDVVNLHSASFAERERAFLLDRLVLAALYQRANEIDDRSRLAEAKIMKTDQVIIDAHLGWFWDFETKQWKWHEVTPDQLLALESMEIIEKPDGTIRYKIKIHNKHASLERQSKVMRMQGNDTNYWEQNKPRPPVIDNSGSNNGANKYAKLLEKHKLI